MPDQELLPAFGAALRQNEIGKGSPYKVSFAEKGNSGCSFGFMQGDLNAKSPLVAKAFHDALIAGGLSETEVEHYETLLAGPQPADPLSPEQETQIDDALSSQAGRACVDAMDERLLELSLRYVDQCIAAAHATGRRLSPEAQLAIALWTNMSGAPDQLMRWLRGEESTVKAPAPPPELVSLDAMQGYLACTQYFRANPGNLSSFLAAVKAGSKLVPSHPGTLMRSLQTLREAIFERQVDALDALLDLPIRTFGSFALPSTESPAVWFVYEQKSGHFLQHEITGDTLIDAYGYSGSLSKGGLNNPDDQYLEGVGPIPVGRYHIGHARAQPTLYTFPLAPSADTDLHGRHDFLIHGGCRDGTLNASTGCIVLSLETRSLIASSGVTVLLVVQGD